MASIQDVVNAAHRIKQNAEGLQKRSLASAESLRRHSGQLAATVRGSRSGENAVRQVSEAERALRTSSVRLMALQRDIDAFIEDLTK